jgi:hypothetical protein
MDLLESQGLFVLPVTGGLTGDPSVLTSVNEFLRDESNFDKVNNLLQQEISLQEYRSLSDFLLIELLPEFKNDCVLFYQEKGKSFSERYPAEVRSSVDEKMRGILESLDSENYESWTHFKRTFQTAMDWEALQSNTIQ